MTDEVFARCLRRRRGNLHGDLSSGSVRHLLSKLWDSDKKKKNSVGDGAAIPCDAGMGA